MPELPILEVKHKDGTTAYKCREVDGIKYSLAIQDPELRVKEIRELNYKDGDIFIASYPKVGTNWIKDSLGMLLKGKPELSWMTGTMIDLTPSLDNYRKQDSRRVAITHLRPAQLSVDQNMKATFILGIRNPKDAAVSAFHHIRKDRMIQFKGSWDQFFDLVIQGQVIYGRFIDYYRHWQEFVKSHEKQILIVYYEDMHKDYQKQLRRMADFLGLTVTDETIKQITEKGQIKTVLDSLMKEPEYLAFTESGKRDLSMFYRKGVVGDWKNHFTVTQNEIFDQMIEREMKDSIFNFDYVI